MMPKAPNPKSRTGRRPKQTPWPKVLKKMNFRIRLESAVDKYKERIAGEKNPRKKKFYEWRLKILKTKFEKIDKEVDFDIYMGYGGGQKS